MARLTCRRWPPQFGVTTETIRRDLSDLQDRQLVRRVHGGAVPLERRYHEPMVDARDVLNADEKLRIAREAITEVPEHGSVIIDSGSTGQRLAEVFPSIVDVHVDHQLPDHRGRRWCGAVCALTVLGGVVRTNTFAMVDASTADALRELRVDVFFMSCDGLSFPRGPDDPVLTTRALLKRAMIDRARRVVAIVDQSKFGNDQLFNFAGLDELDVLITDTGPTTPPVD